MRPEGRDDPPSPRAPAQPAAGATVRASRRQAATILSMSESGSGEISSRRIVQAWDVLDNVGAQQVVVQVK